MTTPRSFYLIDESTAVSLAVGQLLLPDSSLDDVAAAFDVPEQRLRDVVLSIGLEDEVPSLSTPDPSDLPPPRPWPEFLRDRDDLNRRRDGIRSEEVPESAREYQISFFRWLISEGAQIAREAVAELVYDELGEEADPVSVAQYAVPSTRGFPPHVRLIVVQYPVQAPGADRPVVPNPPEFPFGDLDDFLPTVVEAEVDCDGERIRIEQIPVVARKVVLR